MKKIGVVGAGPAGMTAAYQLSKLGYQVVIIEADKQVGGMSKTIDLWGQKVDLGPHRFFSSERRINELWLEVVGKKYFMVDRLTRIFYKNRFFYYPLKPFDALFKLGIIEAFFCVLSYGVHAILLKKKDPQTFKDWVTSRFGKRLFNIFFKTYSEKLWGVSCENIDADFAAQRIKKLTLFGTIWNALTDGRRNKHKTLVDRFAYPEGGTGRVYELMADKIRDLGGEILLNTKVKGILCRNNTAYGVALSDGSQIHFDHVISTMPLSLMVQSLPGIPEKVRESVSKLSFRNTVLVYLEVADKNLFPDNWLYIHSADILCGRVTNFRNWSPDLYQGAQSTVLCLEYWCNSEDDMWQWEDQKFISMAEDEIRKTKLIGEAKILNGHCHRINRSYPVYKTGYREALQPITSYLDQIEGLTAIGRYGSFKYNNQDHSILMGILAAENIGEGKSHDLWDVNTDDDYQEEASIEELGLHNDLQKATV